MHSISFVNILKLQVLTRYTEASADAMNAFTLFSYYICLWIVIRPVKYGWP